MGLRAGKDCLFAGACDILTRVKNMITTSRLLNLIQGQVHALTGYLTERGWGRIYCTWLMMDRADCEVIAVICAGGLILLSAVLAGAAALLIRRRTRAAKQ